MTQLRIPDGKARASVPVLRARKCKLPSCGERFTPRRPMQPYCSPACESAAAPAIAERIAARRAREARRAARLERQADNAKREAMKSRSDLTREAQAAFNRWVKLRDAGRPCICCGRPMEPQRPGGSVDAGHWRSVGAAKHLRFDPDNCHAQRKNCNRPGGTTDAAFRDGMIERIGLAAVQRLEQDNTVRKWTADELREIRDRYRRMARELARGMT